MNTFLEAHNARPDRYSFAAASFCFTYHHKIRVSISLLIVLNKKLKLSSAPKATSLFVVHSYQTREVRVVAIFNLMDKKIFNKLFLD